MKSQLAKLATVVACAAVYVVGIVQPACVGIFHEPEISKDMFK
jgi:cyclic lactone autoinducer peptide